MKRALVILFAATALWFIGATQWYVCNVQYLCSPLSPPSANQAGGAAASEKSIFEQVFGIEKGAISPDGAATTSSKMERQTVQFLPDSTDFVVDEEAKKQLAAVLTYANANPEKTFTITGYTADVGPYYGDCEWMSRVRAERVAELLIESGIDPSRITTRGRAALDPVGDNSTAEGMAANRRAEIIVN